jgi:protein CMS1
MSQSKKRSLDGEKTSRKKRKKSAAKQDEEDLIDLEAGINRAISLMDGQLLSDYLAQNVDRFGKELSSIEKADLAISGAAHIRH